MHCIFNERLITYGDGARHVRQLRECREGERYPFLSDNRATIHVINDTQYVARSSRGEVIAISDTFDTVLNRIKYGQFNAEINVIYNDETITLERYRELTAPTIYRLVMSDSDELGELVALDVYEKGEVVGDPLLFDRVYDAVYYILERQQSDEYYHVVRSKYRPHDAFGELGGLQDYEPTEKVAKLSHLITHITQERQRQREYIEQMEGDM